MPVAKRLSLNEIRDRVAKFAVDYQGITQEKQHTADFWKAFMACYGVEDTYLHGVTFEYPARRSDTGGTGYVDVFFPGRFLIEQKSDGMITRPRLGDWSNAEQQANAYLTGGSITRAQQPRWLITSDFSTIQLTDLNELRTSQRRNLTIPMRDLVDHVEAFLFLADDDPEQMIAEDQAEASIKAARLMGDLYTAMTGDADEPENEEEEDDASQDISVLLTRLLFLLFGDDAGLWKRGLFARFIEDRTSVDGSDLGAQLTALFEVLNTPEHRRSKHVDEAMSTFPYVNGGIFDGTARVAFFDARMRRAVLDACAFDWSRISPAVFGSLFQTVKSKAARRSDGEHYTSEENILKTLRPMFLDDLRARLDRASTKPQLEELHEELKSYRYVDPACGCGNFLVVGYREMRAFELDLLLKLQAKRGKEDELILDPADMLNVRLDQFYGVELNWWPAKIAETAMFLVDHQANQEMAKVLGVTPRRLPIDIAANITHANALTTDWDKVLPQPGPTIRIFGNPPFAGRKERTKAQTSELAAAWGLRTPGHMDYVTAWHAKASKYLRDKSGEFAFVATNSMTQGEPVAAVFDPLRLAGWKIKFAHRTFNWRSESASKERAAVHVVILGFTKDAAATRRVFDYEVAPGSPTELRGWLNINGYLLDAPDVYARKRLSPISPELPDIGYGSMPNDGGHLIIEKDAYPEAVADPVAAKYIRRLVGSKEIVNNIDRWCLWLVNLDPADVHKSPFLQARIEATRRARLASRNPDTVEKAATPHLFWFINQPTVPLMAIPSVVSLRRSYITAAHYGPDVIVTNLGNVCEDPDGFAFGILSSAMCMTWQRAIGGRLKSDVRFTNTLTWNNLPLPSIDATLRQQVAEGGRGVLAARELHPDRTLAQHYERLAMDPALVDAHHALDKVVDKAFGAGRGRMDEERRQKILFARFAEFLAGTSK